MSGTMINAKTKNEFRDILVEALSEGGLNLKKGVVNHIEAVVLYVTDNEENNTEMAPLEYIAEVECTDGCNAEKIEQLLQDNESLLYTNAEEICNILEQSIDIGEPCVTIKQLRKVQRIVPGAIAASEHVIIMLLLRPKIYYYREVIEYVLLQLIDRAQKQGSLRELNTSEVVKKIIEPFRKNWYLMGGYADYYLKQKNLPAAEQIIELSAACYEGSESQARIYFTSKNLETLSTLIQPLPEERTIKSDKCRMIRKLMELSKQNAVYLYARKNEDQEFVVEELVQLKKEREGEQGEKKEVETDLYIMFSGFLHWSVYQGKREELTYKNGKYEINCTGENEKYLDDINALDSVDHVMLKKLVDILKEQKHGTAAIVSDFNGNKEEEIQRLCAVNRAVRLGSELKYRSDTSDSCGWDEEQLLSLTNVDGALFIDLKGNCFAFSVLVDGEAVIKGDVGRGSRYNSIANYVKKQMHGIYIGIVVSEDKMINIVSNQEK